MGLFHFNFMSLSWANWSEFSTKTVMFSHKGDHWWTNPMYSEAHICCKHRRRGNPKVTCQRECKQRQSALNEWNSKPAARPAQSQARKVRRSRCLDRRSAGLGYQCALWGSSYLFCVSYICLRIFEMLCCLDIIVFHSWGSSSLVCVSYFLKY